MANLKEDVTNTVWSAIEGIANIFGLGSLVSNFAKNIGYTSDSASVNKAINMIVENAKIKSMKQLDDLQNMLTDLPEVKSNVVKDIIVSKRNEIRNNIQEQTARMNKADTKLNQAVTRAANIDYLTVGQKNKAQEAALGEAQEAANLYANKTNENNVEKEI